MKKTLFGLMAILVFSFSASASTVFPVEEAPPDISIVDVTLDNDFTIGVYSSLEMTLFPEAGDMFVTLEEDLEYSYCNCYLKHEADSRESRYWTYNLNIENPPALELPDKTASAHIDPGDYNRIFNSGLSSSFLHINPGWHNFS